MLDLDAIEKAAIDGDDWTHLRHETVLRLVAEIRMLRDEIRRRREERKQMRDELKRAPLSAHDAFRVLSALAARGGGALVLAPADHARVPDGSTLVIEKSGTHGGTLTCIRLESP